MWILYVFFALASTIGAWVVWRRNPLYSLPQTVKVVVGFLIGITLFILVINLLIHAVDRAHLGVGASTAILVTFSVGSTLAVCFYAIGASGPKVKLPAAATLLDVNRRRVRRWLQPLVLCNGFVLVPSLYFLLARSHWWAALVTLGGIFDLIAGIILASLYFQARVADRSITSLEFEPWITWQFTPAQWQDFTEAQVAQSAAALAAQRAAPSFNVRTDWKTLVVPVFVLVFLAFLFREDPLGLLIAFLALASLFLIIFLSTGHRNTTAAANRRKKLATATPEAFFGAAGVFAEGDYTPWLTISSFLTDAWRTPTTLMLRFNKQVPSRTGSVTVIEEKAIPLPPNPQSDLASLQQHLTSLCPEARIALA